MQCEAWKQFLMEDLFLNVMHQDEENAKAITLFKDVVQLNDAIEEESKRVENLVRGIFAGNIFDLGSAQVTICSFQSKENINSTLLIF